MSSPKIATEVFLIQKYFGSARPSVETLVASATKFRHMVGPGDSDSMATECNKVLQFSSTDYLKKPSLLKLETRPDHTRPTEIKEMLGGGKH
eukprot:gene10446-8400_t